MPVLLEPPLLDDVGDLRLIDEHLPASVTITRTSDQDVKQRQMHVYLDGLRIATLMFGDSITWDLDPGHHQVRVSNTLVWKTVEFDLRRGEQVFFETINRAGFGTYPMLLIIGVAPLYVTLERMF
ncbi:MAG TPA: hypothetical protein VFX12_15595 [Vicinamibacterales bacterium]|nr:hypothetical protein [Vicinamibacterales bacterium]